MTIMPMGKMMRGDAIPAGPDMAKTAAGCFLIKTNAGGNGMPLMAGYSPAGAREM
jgi:hypothetical protein